MNPPRVFISYSHDSAKHKEWVLNFATTLRQRGVDAVIDQWDLKPGDDLPHFMESQLANADFAIMVCTDRYVEKANAGEGAVGYEKMIMTSSLLTKIDGNKVIPIIRENSSKQTPTFMQSKLFVDFSNDNDIEYSLDELLRTLLNSPLYEKPEIGTNPFKPLNESKPDRTSDGVKQVMRYVADSFENTHSKTIELLDIMQHSDMHRLTLDRYISMAIEQELLYRSLAGYIEVTSKGIEYLIEHGVIDA